MTTAFITGLIIGVAGILLSIAASNWQIAFLLSGVSAGFSLIIGGMLRNFSLIMKKKSKYKGSVSDLPLTDEENWVKGIIAFGIPNLVIAVVLYFILYRGQ